MMAKAPKQSSIGRSQLQFRSRGKEGSWVCASMAACTDFPLELVLHATKEWPLLGKQCPANSSALEDVWVKSILLNGGAACLKAGRRMGEGNLFL